MKTMQCEKITGAIERVLDQLAKLEDCPDLPPEAMHAVLEAQTASRDARRWVKDAWRESASASASPPR